ncbi:hypothetical protein EDD37DRAFT_654458 [Exophiala viscosa]|uniref:Uncharacterized protein n=1 Tax=Exophiala viscosa TaxID=2486360 RepID=A0AAN6IEA6_9EURO|nr:hypothetical protein EDD36DRAFT_464571 [Exophiala viscosa]KAI1619898.1 hypothetical protein EDD37DRAFT_654458 [Exophiala viscosa]
MRKPSIPELIYQRTFPKPKQGDPSSFYAFVHRHIVAEIRTEVQTYYGALDTLEAQYPGLDYTYLPHRRRLSRHTWHRRLFRVFDDLGLTNDEILSLCQWEGTRAAKERYEREAQTEVKTTTGNDLPTTTRGSGPRAVWEDWSRSAPGPASPAYTAIPEADEVEDTDMPEPQQPTDDQSGSSEYDIVGLVRDAMQERLTGTSLAISEEWEQWLKDALERHTVDVDVILAAVQELEPQVLGTVSDHTGDLDFTPATTPSLSSPPTAQSSHGHIYDEPHDILNDPDTMNAHLAVLNSAPLSLSRSQTEAAR